MNNLVKYDVAAWLVSSVLIFIGLATSSQGQIVKPLARADFRLDTTLFLDFDGASRTSVAQHMTDTLRMLCATHYGFLDWRSAHDTTADVTAATPTLQVTMHTSDSNEFGGTFVLDFDGVIDTETFAMSPVLPLLVYERWDLVPAHNPSQLQTDLQAVLKSGFSNESDRNALHARFLSRIPIATTVHADSGDHRIIIPLPWVGVQASTESLIHVAFTAQSDGILKSGLLDVMPEGQSFKDPWTGSLQCVIALFSYPPVRSQDWHVTIPHVLDSSQVRDLRVYMQTYIPDASPSHSNGLVSDVE